MSGYIGTQPVPQATQTRDSFTATANQTSFATSGYTPEFLDVFLNGVKLAASDYTATNGSDVVLASGAAASDILEVVAYSTFEVLNPTFDGNVTFTGNASFGDNDKAIFGDGSDLQIYHNGSHSLIEDSGQGDLKLRGANLKLQDPDGNDFISMTDTGSGGTVELKNTGTTRLATTSTGIDVTGTAVMDGLTVDGGSNGTIDFGDVTTAYGRLYADNTGTFVGSKTNQPLILRTNNAERMRIDSSGNLGIGTTSPSAYGKFVVQGAGNLLNLNATSGVAYQAFYENGTGRFYLGTLNGSDGLAFIDADGSTERMRIDSSGNLLLGKTVINSATVGVEARGDGRLFAGATSSYSAFFNRKSSDGAIAHFAKDDNIVGSISIKSGDLVIHSSTTDHVGLMFGNTRIEPTNNYGTTSDNTVDLGNTDRRFKDLYLAGGVYLGGIGAANKLDDYEEGTWTPSLKGTTNNNAFTLSGAGGSYVKIGNQVTVNFMIAASSMNGSSGVLQLRDLPFTVSDVMSTTGIEANGVGAYWASWATSINHLTYAAENSTNLLYLYGTTSGTQVSISNLTAAHMGNSGALRGSITYRTT